MSRLSETHVAQMDSRLDLREQFADQMTVVYPAAALILLIFTYSRGTASQDNWILDGLLLPFIVFVLLSIYMFLATKSVSKLVFYCTIFVATLNLIPLAKYSIVYGGDPDSYLHLQLVMGIVNSGHVPPGNVYSTSPGMHLFVAMFSIILGMNPDVALPCAIALGYSALPGVVYWISKIFISEARLRKYVVMAASFPIVRTFNVVGTLFPLLFVLLAVIATIALATRVQHQFVFYSLQVIMIVSILIGHTITPLLFLLFILIDAVIALLLRLRAVPAANALLRVLANLLLLITVIYAASWLSPASAPILGAIIYQLKTITVGGQIKPTIPTTFFAISLIARLKILLVTHSADFIEGCMISIGIFLLVKKRRLFLDREGIFYGLMILFLIPIIGIAALSLVTQYGNLELYRLVYYAAVFCPFLFGVVLHRLDAYFRSRHMRVSAVKSVIGVVFLLSIMFAVIQFYPYQPMVPTAASLNANFGFPNEPLTYVHDVNTVYQLNSLAFLGAHCANPTLTAGDRYSELQMEAFLEAQLPARGCTVADVSALNTVEYHVRWRLLMLHDANGGGFQESLEFRSPDIIQSYKNEVGINLIYNNGPSFIVEKSAWPAS